MNYYNEFDPKAAQWLRNLIAGGLLPSGDVDERSITEVKADEIRGYTQCHFFAGIGGWSYALHLAGWPSDRPVWTGSCPCQPFSSAGNQKGKADERHLWPVWFNLIREFRPAAIFAEQVSSAIAHGWLDDVYQGLEAEGYACGSAVLPACSVGSPHKRDRLWFVAHANSGRRHTQPLLNTSSAGWENNANVIESGEDGDVADTQRQQAHQEQLGPATDERERITDLSSGCHMDSQWIAGVWINCPDGKQRLVEPSIPLLAHGIPARVPKLRALGNAIVPQVAAEFIGAYMDVVR